MHSFVMFQWLSYYKIEIYIDMYQNTMSYVRKYHINLWN